MSTVRSTLLLVVLAALGGGLFFAVVADLWPLLPGNLEPRPDFWRDRMMQLDRLVGTRLERYHMESRVRVDGAALDYLERTCGRERTSAFISQDHLPLAWHRVTLKEAGNADAVTVLFLLDGTVMGWERSVQDDTSEEDPKEAPESLARAAGERLVGDLSPYQVIERASRTMPSRTDRRWTFEREVPGTGDPALRERIQVDLAGDRVARAMRGLVVPAAAIRASRAHAAPIQGLEALGFTLLTVGAVIAAAIALVQLRRGGARLRAARRRRRSRWRSCSRPPMRCSPPCSSRSWDPLWPRWLAAARDLAYGS